VNSEPDDAPAVAEDGSPPRRKLLEQLVKVLFGLAVVAFGVAFVWDRHRQLGDALSRARPGWLVVAVVAAGVGQWAAVAGFRAVLAATSGRWLPETEVGRMYFVSQLGKYIPGSVWAFVALTAMCQRYGIGKRPAGVAAVLTLLFSLMTAGLLGIVLVLAGASGGAAGLWWLALLLPVGFAALHPRVVVPAVNRLLRLARREPVNIQLTGKALRGSLGWPTVSWVLLGLQCWAIVVALGGSVWGSLLGSVGGFALAYTAGTLFVPAPAGAGVREAVLGVALAGVVNDSPAFGHNEVIVAVLLSRGLLAVLDFAQAGGAVLLARYGRARTAARTVVGG
jgi:hypothetical protein